MRKVIILVLLSVGLLSFQDVGPKWVNSISVKGDYFTTDNLGFIYVGLGDELTKYYPDGRKMNRYSNMALGEPTTVDAANPMKIVLYYRELTQLVFLDNTLSLQGNPISLEEMDLEQVTLVCSSVNSSVWVYDQATFQLIRLNKELKRIHETGNIGQLLNIELNPIHLVERNNWVYLNDPKYGVLVFDIFGTYYKTIPVKAVTEMQVFEDKLFYVKDKRLHSFDFKANLENEFALPDPTATKARVGKQRLLLLTPTEVQVYIVDN